MRTVINRSELIEGVLSALQTNISSFKIGDGIRPVIESVDPDKDRKYYDPPYAVLHLRPGGDLDGPLTDSQADAVFSVQITAVGNTQIEALRVQDTCAKYMDRSYITIPNRKIRTIKKDFASNGTERDDDVPTPVYYSFEIYDIDTTPA